MNNQLTLWYKDPEKTVEQLIRDIKSEIRVALQLNYFIEVGDDDSFKFLFDDETGGEIEITFTVEPDESLKVVVKGTWAWEVIEVYNNVLPDYEEVA